MKVLISRKDLRDTTSGVPKKVLQELKFFNERGHQSFAIAETINKAMIEEFGGIAVKTLKWPFSGYWRRRFYLKQVERWIKKEKPDLVIGHGDILNQDILFIHNCVHLASELIEGKSLAKNHEVGRIHTEILTKGTYKLLICNSELMRLDLIERFKINPSKVRVIYPEVNLTKFVVENPTQLKLQGRTEFGFIEEDFVVGLVTSGNFKKRNLGLLIEAFQDLVKVYPRAKLFIAGGNIDQKYIDMAPQSGVVFAPPIIDVKKYYHLLDVFVLPAHIEEFGRSVLEAMFCGLPVITTKYVGASEIFEGISRKLIMNELSRSLLTNLLLDLTNKEFAIEVSEQNKRTSLTYSAEVQGQVFDQVLKEFQFKIN